MTSYINISSNAIIMVSLICYLIFRGTILVLKKKKSNKINWYKGGILLLFAIHSYIVILVTLFPITIGLQRGYSQWSMINYIPFVTVFRLLSGNPYGDILFSIKLVVRNVGGNLLILAPLGILLPLLWKQCRSWKRILLTGFLVSFSIEMLQLVENVCYLSMARIVDIDDIFCNVIGTMIGYVIFRFVYVIATKKNSVSKAFTSAK